MSPRIKKENEEIREKRRIQILDATLTIYIEQGFNGSDMDQIAARAGLAKGLIYYYFKTKQDLFREMFDWAFGFLMDLNQRLIKADSSIRDPVERLLRYTYRIFGLVEKDMRALRFAMRLPFDAYAVFGAKEWRTGLERSALFMNTIVSMIKDIIASKQIPDIDAITAGNSFWAVFIANCFNFIQMIGTTKKVDSRMTVKEKKRQLEEIVGFCFQGLGIGREIWIRHIEKIEGEL